jgi:uncharacterized membrane protein YhaH (DUF805 family)
MPVTLRVAIGLLWVQFLGLLGLLAIFAYYVARERTALGFYVGFFLLIFTLAWFFILLALGRRRSAARGAVVALELLVLAPAYYMITGGRPLWGAILGAISLAVVGLLVAPSTGKVLS